MAARPAPAATEGRARWAVLAAFAALGTAAGSWGARIPDVKDDLHLTEGSLASALLGLSVGAVAGAWIGGALVRRLGSKRVIVASWLAVGAVLAGPGLAGRWATLAVATLVLGLAIGVLDVSMNGAGVQLEHASDVPLLNGLHAGWSAGVLGGAGLGAVAVAVGIGPGAHLLAVGAVLVVAGLAASAHVPDGRIATPGLADQPDDLPPSTGPDADSFRARPTPPDREYRAQSPVGRAEPLPGASRLHGRGDAPPERGVPGSPSEGRSARGALGGAGRTAQLVALAAIGGFVFLGEGALMDWAGVLVRDDLGGGALLGALAVTGLSTGGLVGRLAGDRLSVRWGPPVLVRRGSTVAAVALTAALLTPVAATVPLLLVAVGAGLAPAVPLAFAAAGHRWGEHGIAVVTTAGYGCYLAAPAVVGGLAHATSLRPALLVPLALIVGVVPLAWSTHDPGPQTEMA